ncbi:ThuA domain-containing protein [Thermogutta sp.]|uniref:ThuA domain-containing protein n=1 Tax=Thermogutta sp. TaxID=1962930 RepID=UPI003C7DD2AD
MTRPTSVSKCFCGLGLPSYLAPRIRVGVSTVRWMLLGLITGMTVFVTVSAGFEGRASEQNEQPGAQSARVRCLIVTGEDYPGHKWRETTPILKKLLEARGDIAVDVAEDLTVLRTEKPFQYQVVILHFKNYDPNVPGREGLQTLERFVHEGGGLMLVHFACGAFQEFKEDFLKLVGRVWDPQLRGHDPYGSFKVRIVDSEHPITRGLQDFDTVDELYTCLTGDLPIHVLAVARSKVDGKDYPMAFVLRVGKGRVFHCVLGHDVKAFQSEGVQTLFRRACLWCAGRLAEASQAVSLKME